MKHSSQVWHSFGVASGAITTLGLIVILHSVCVLNVFCWVMRLSPNIVIVRGRSRGDMIVK